MDFDSKKIGVIVIVSMMVVIFAGEAISYNNPYYSEFSAERVDDEILYSISSNLSREYTAVSLDNGNMYDIDRYVAFFDDAYPMPDGKDGVRGALDWLRHNLQKYRIDLEILGFDDMERIVNDLDVSVALVFATGMLPAGIYSGSPDDPLFKWLKAGGVMYWMNGKIGQRYAESGSTLQEVLNPDPLFFGIDNVVRKSTSIGYGRNLSEGSLTDVLGIYFGEYTNGMDTRRLGTDLLSLDYTSSSGRYSAVVFVKYHDGEGMICNIGGALNHDTAHAVAQIIAPRLTYESKVVDHFTGQVNKVPKGSLQSAVNDAYMFIYIGNSMTVIGGQCIRL